MDINCTNRCMYQKEGKCSFSQVAQGQKYILKRNEGDCAYYIEAHQG